MDVELSVLDLFGGIGGFSVGLGLPARDLKQLHLWKRINSVKKFYKKHWQGTTIFEDIRI